MTIHRKFTTTALALVMAAGAGAAFAQDQSQGQQQQAAEQQREQGQQQQAAEQQREQGQRQATGERRQAAAEDGMMRRSERIPMTDWGYDSLYREGRSVQRMMETTDVNGVEDEDIGEVEDVILSPDGQVLALIVEIGGFLDIGDTHVSVPWSEVELNAAGDGINVPINEDNIGEYTLFDREMLGGDALGEEMMAEVDDAVAGERAWRASELIGDYARVQDQDAWSNYGYVSDIIIQDGKVASVIITPDVSYGVGGYYAMPYYGYGTGYGWTPGATRYDMPYSKVEMGDLEPFEYERMEGMRAG